MEVECAKLASFGRNLMYAYETSRLPDSALDHRRLGSYVGSYVVRRRIVGSYDRRIICRRMIVGSYVVRHLQNVWCI